MKTFGIKHVTTFSDYSPLCSGLCLYAAEMTKDNACLLPIVTFPIFMVHLTPLSYTLNYSLLFTVWSLLSHIFVFYGFACIFFFPTPTSPVWKDKIRSMTVKPWNVSLVLLWVTPLSRLTVVGQQLCLLPFLYAGGAHRSIQRKVGYVCLIQLQWPFYLWTGQCLLWTTVSFFFSTHLSLNLWACWRR